MQTKHEWKKCPFCGERGHDIEYVVMGSSTWAVKCLNLECDVMAETIAFRTKDEAWDAWNRRAT